jgi:hypothetical protein
VAIKNVITQIVLAKIAIVVTVARVKLEELSYKSLSLNKPPVFQVAYSTKGDFDARHSGYN